MKSHLAPFAGWVPAGNKPEEVVTMSFDFYAKDRVESYLNQYPDSYFHIIVPPAVREGKACSAQEKSEASAAMLRQMIQNGVFRRTASAFYLYKQKRNGKSYTGLICAVHVDSITEGKLIPHEETIARREEKLMEYLDVVGMNAEPVCLTFQNGETIADSWEPFTDREPDLHFSLEEFGEHALWIIDQPEQIEAIYNQLGQISRLFIADGHHRVASSRRLAEKRKTQSTGADQYFMAALFPDSELEILPFHRFVRGLSEEEIQNFLQELEKRFGLYPEEKPREGAELQLYVNGHWYEIPRKESDQLLSAWLSEEILHTMLGISDLRHDPRIGFLGGSVSTETFVNELEKRKAQLGFYLAPIPLPVFFSEAAQGHFMPPKSTWFEPKLPNGLTMLDLNASL